MQNAQPADYQETIELRRWFGLTESMTAAVAHHCRGKASVTLLGEGTEAANHWERDGSQLTSQCLRATHKSGC